MKINNDITWIARFALDQARKITDLKESHTFLNHIFPLQHSIAVENTTILLPEKEIVFTYQNQIKIISFTQEEWNQFISFLKEGKIQ